MKPRAIFVPKDFKSFEPIMELLLRRKDYLTPRVSAKECIRAETYEATCTYEGPCESRNIEGSCTFEGPCESLDLVGWWKIRNNHRSPKPNR